MGCLLALTMLAIAVHGYHPFVEDAEIYVPGIEKLLHPALFPVNDIFFSSHARLTLFPNLIAWSVRLTHLPLEWALGAWHFATVFLLLAGAWRLSELCFKSRRAAWGATSLLASLLTLPVAGTALYVMDQYVNPRSFSTAFLLWIVLATAERRYVRVGLWILATALIHPLMAVFSAVFVLLLIGGRELHRTAGYASTFANLPGLRGLTSPDPRSATQKTSVSLMLFPPVSAAYRQVLDSHSYFFPLRWAWYEWLGVAGPLILTGWFSTIARRKRLPDAELLCTTSIAFAVLCVIAGLGVTVPPALVRFAELQPMRGMLLVYVLLSLFAGGLLAENVLKSSSLRWLALFLPLTAGMFYAQRQLFPATDHLELPGRGTGNAWVSAFRWIQGNTPADAYFALDPDHMRIPGEDQHGFRAIAQRSMLADRVKDSGAVSMFPGLADEWLRQISATNSWTSFSAGDFARLHERYGVTWVVLQNSAISGLDCPYRNSEVLVCRVSPEAASSQ